MEDFEQDDYIKRLKDRYKKDKSSSDENQQSNDSTDQDNTTTHKSGLEVVDISSDDKTSDQESEQSNENDPDNSDISSDELNDEPDLQTKKEEKKRPPIFKILIRSYPYLSVLFWYVVAMFGIVYLVDNFIIEPQIHERPILEMPKVEGMKYEEAIELLEKKNLRYELINEQYNSKYKKGEVIRQKPEPDKLVREGRPVYLTKSIGSEKLLAPNVTGMPYRQARVRIINEGLELGTTTYKHSEVIPADTVMSQSIKAGTKLQYGDKINLVVSKGSEKMLRVPDLVYKDLDEIEDLLGEYGLRIGVITYIEDETYENGVVIGQFPPAGEQTLKNSYVDIEVIQNPE